MRCHHMDTESVSPNVVAERVAGSTQHLAEGLDETGEIAECAVSLRWSARRGVVKFAVSRHGGTLRVTR